MYETLTKEATAVAEELIKKAKLTEGKIVVVGCSTSEVCGEKIGTASVPEVAEALFLALKKVFDEAGIIIAAQCCEHLNRAIITERKAVSADNIVNVVPQPKAGGSFATAAYKFLCDPVAVEEIKADAGIDIGQTLIGMHLKKVAVPLRLETKTIGHAMITAARVRPKFIGGARAHYNDDLL